MGHLPAHRVPEGPEEPPHQDPHRRRPGVHQVHVAEGLAAVVVEAHQHAPRRGPREGVAEALEARGVAHQRGVEITLDGVDDAIGAREEAQVVGHRVRVVVDHVLAHLSQGAGQREAGPQGVPVGAPMHRHQKSPSFADQVRDPLKHVPSRARVGKGQIILPRPRM